MPSKPVFKHRADSNLSFLSVPSQSQLEKVNIPYIWPYILLFPLVSDTELDTRQFIKHLSESASKQFSIAAAMGMLIGAWGCSRQGA